MLRYEEYTNEKMDTCDICDAQMEYLFAFGLTQACMQIGK